MRRSRVAEAVTFAALIGLYVAPLWAFRYVPSEDGPSHLGNAFIIANYDRPAAATFRAFFVLSDRPLPNVGYHYLLATLLRFIPPLLAEKIVLTAYVVAFAFAFRYLARAGAGPPSPAYTLAFPFIYAYPVQMGFFGFALSLPLAFFGLGFYLRRRGALGIGGAVLLNAAGVAAYFCHLLGWGLLVGGVLYAAAADVVIARARRHPIPWKRLLIGVYLVPAVVPGIWYYFTEKRLDRPTWRPVTYLWRHLFEGYVLAALNKYQVTLGEVAAVSFGALIIAAVAAAVNEARRAERVTGPRSVERGLFWGTALVLAGLAYFILPDSTPFRGNFISCRLAMVPYLIAAAWLTGVTDRWVRTAAGVAGVALALAAWWGVWSGFRAADGILREFNAGVPYVARGTTVAMVTYAYSPNTKARVNFTKHGGGYYVARTYAPDFTNYEPNYRYFPVQWRGGHKPLPYKGVVNGTPTFDFTRAKAQVDYIIGWNIDWTVGGMPEVLKQYELAHREGRLAVWRRRPGAP